MKPNNTVIVAYCGLMLTLSAFSVDIVLPAFPRIGVALDASPNIVQLTIPVFIAAIGVGQLICGSLSDRWGRRPVIIGGLTLFFAGSVLAALAGSIEVLLIGRVLQGFGGAVGPVIGRAVIRDIFTGEELARNMALAMAVFAFGPIVAPLLGAGLMWLAGWRVIFGIMIAFALCLLAFCLFVLPETLARKQSNATKLSKLKANTVAIFRDPQSRFYLLLSGLIYGLMLLILTNLPQVFDKNFGVSGTAFAILFAIHGIGIIIGQIANRALIPKAGVLTTTVLGSLVLFLVSLFQLAGAHLGLLSAYLISGLMVIFATSFLIVYANAASLTLDPHGSIAGFTSSFFGFFGQLVGTAIIIPLSFYISGDLVRMAMCLFLMTSIVLSALSWKRFGGSHP